MLIRRAAQELGNSLADLRRQLGEAADERATMQTVQRQSAADLARATADADAARAQGDATGRALAKATTQLKVACSAVLDTQKGMKM